MNKAIRFFMASLMMMPMALWGQTYSAMWKQVKTAEEQDLPKTQMNVLNQICSKAAGEKTYGQLFKASLKRVNVVTSISLDSLRPEVDRLTRDWRKAGDEVVKATYATVLYKIYNDHKHELEADDATVAKWAEEALRKPSALAKAKADVYEPFVVKGYNASVFDGDMLSVIGYETGRFDVLSRFYAKQGNRRAACMAALSQLDGTRHAPSKVRISFANARPKLNKSAYIHSLDSLLRVYADLDVAGEVAVVRYNAMSECSDVTVEDKINYIHYALTHWGAWQRAGELRSAEKDLTASRFNLEVGQRVASSHERRKVILSVRNLSELKLNVYRVNATGELQVNPNSEEGYKKLRPLMSANPVRTLTKTFFAHPKYQNFTDSLFIEPLPKGVYMLEVTSTPSVPVRRSIYQVSDLYVMELPLPGNAQRFAVVDVTTGQPVPGAKIRVKSSRKNGKDKELVCDAKGEVVYKPENGRNAYDRLVYVYTDNDKAAPVDRIHDNFYIMEEEGRHAFIQSFADRTIYRPGQTVRCVSIMASTDGKTSQALSGQTLTFTLYDTNGKPQSTQTATTDKYGSCSADFHLPERGINGYYRIETSAQDKKVFATCSFRMEEYKRPTFVVEFPEVNQKYQAGDTLSVKATARSYAGIPVQGARVSYRVVRRPSLWWRSYQLDSSRSLSGDVTLCNGETVTDADGHFKVDFPLLVPDEVEGQRMFYRFSVEADVTDLNGETRHGDMSVPLGTRPTAISCSLADKELADTLSGVTVYLKNAAGINVSTAVKMRIDDGAWLEGRTMTPIRLPERLSPGRHLLYALCDSDTLRHEFVAFGLDDKVPCAPTHDWFFVSAQRFTGQQPVTVQVGSSDADVHVLYTLFSGDKILESGSFDQSNAIYNRKFVYEEGYGDGLTLAYAWVKDGQMYTHETDILRPEPNKTLHLKWTTFRDRLQPGQKEEWKLSVTHADGTPADAQVMASMYDKSLDQLTYGPLQWDFSTGCYSRTALVRWFAMNRGYDFTMSSRQNHSSPKFTSFEYSHFDPELFPYRMYYVGMGSMRNRGGQVLMAKSMVMNERSLDALPLGNIAAKESAAADAPLEVNDGTPLTDVSVRENFNESAFFFPSLLADKKGDVVMKFTLPETLTTWRVVGLAHTSDFCHGMIEGEAVARKELMVQPNMPRFVRRGDKAQVVAKLANMGNGNVSGQVVMELSDPETGEVVYTQSQTFKAEAHHNTSAAFSFVPDDRYPLLVCKMVASGKSTDGRRFSDGEQHYLPVLPDKERVVVTMPFTMPSAGEKTLDISRLFPADDASNKLTVEYTENPAWMMVQALVPMATPSDNNAIDQCAALYANRIAQTLAKESPKVKSTLAQWKNEAQEKGLDDNSLSGNLSKNADLKDIVLSETPWVAEADKENDQKRSLSDLFDDNLLQDRLSSAVGRMESLQKDDGSWSWWSGMEGNTYMTSRIVTMLSRLQMMTGRDASVEKMMERGNRYLDTEMVKMVKKMRQESRKGHPQVFPGTVALEYLYAQALTGRKWTTAAQSAADYLKSLLKKESKAMSLYDKALAAVMFHYSGDESTARLYLKSLKEYMVHTADEGAYFDTPRAYRGWMDDRIPAQVATIEALKAIDPADTQTLADMQRWLLQQKRTQTWNTSINSADALYAFLKGNGSQLDGRAPATLSIDGKQMETPHATAGFGYVKVTVPATKGKTFTVSKTSDGTSWGALYAQYMQKTADIAKSSSGMSVKREIVMPKEGLKVGTKITVRITVDMKHDMDFVQIVDRRAACMEPVQQLSGYRDGAYCSPKDNATCFYFNRLAKGKHVIENEYYIDRAGVYETGTCTVGCAYAPEFRATAKSERLEVAL